MSGSGAHTHQRPSVAPELLPIGWARRGRRARAWLAALSCEHRLERVLLAGADGLLARWRLRWRRCARRARHLARRRRAPSWRWGRNCLKINIISKSGYLVCWGVLCTSRNTSETRAPVSRTHNTRTRGPRERRATARWCAGRSCVPGPCACVEQGWVGRPSRRACPWLTPPRPTPSTRARARPSGRSSPWGAPPCRRRRSGARSRRGW